MTVLEGFPAYLMFDYNNMFDTLIRRPFGPAGYYAFGMLMAFYYYEYQLSHSERSLESKWNFITNTTHYKVMNYFSKNKKRGLIL